MSFEGRFPRLLLLSLLSSPILIAPLGPVQAGCAPYEEAMHWECLRSMPAPVEALEIAGERAYVADGDAGLKILSLERPFVPKTLGTLEIPNDAVDLAVDGDRVVVADRIGSLHLVSCEDPRHPSLRHAYEFGSRIVDIVAAGGYAYAVVEDSLLFVAPLEPPLVQNSVPLPGQPSCLVLAGDYLYVGTCDGRVFVVDIREPALPRYVGAVSAGGCPRTIAVGDGYAYLVGDENSGLVALDLSDPALPVPIHLGPSLPRLEFVWMTVRDSKLFASDRHTLAVLDVASPTHPRLLGSLRLPQVLAGFAIGENVAYVFDETGGIRMADLSGMSSVEAAGVLQLGGTACDLELSGSIALVADGSDALEVIDMEDPAAPRSLARLGGLGPVLRVTAAGSLAFLAAGERGLHVVDLSVPEQPVLRCTFALPGERITDAAVSGRFGYLTTGGTGFFVLDLLNPDHPTIVSRTELSHRFTYPSGRVVVSDGTAFLHGGRNGLTLMDVSDPFFPEFLVTINPGGDSQDLAVANGYAYWADEAVQIIDVADPHAPRMLSWVDTPGVPRALAVRGTVVYAADDAGFHVLDFADPWNPRFLGTAHAPGRPLGVAASNDCMLALDGWSLRTFPLECGGATALSGLSLEAPFPNPSRSGMKLRLEPEREGPLRIQVFGPAGTLVRDLFEGTVEPGHALFQWNARDNAGRTLPAGTYFLRVEWNGRSESRRVVLMR